MPEEVTELLLCGGAAWSDEALGLGEEAGLGEGLGELLLELQQGHSFQYVVQLAPIWGLFSRVLA